MSLNNGITDGGNLVSLISKTVNPKVNVIGRSSYPLSFSDVQLLHEEMMNYYFFN